MKKLLAMMLAGAISVSAAAAEWVDLGKSADKKIQLYIDIDSVRAYSKRIPLQSSSSNNFVSGFIQFTYINNHEYRKKGWYYSKDFYIVDCSSGSYLNPGSVVYGFKDQVLDSFTQSYFTVNDFKMAYPETLGEVIVDSICNAYEYQ